MGKYRVLTGTAPFRFGEGLLWILQEYLLFCICCSKIPYTFRQIQSVQETVVISIVCITPRTGSFPFSPGSHSTAALHRRNASLFYTACVIHGQHAAACPNLPGQELILFTVKVKGDWLNRVAFQRAHTPLYKGLEQSSLWPQRKAGKIILKIVFQFRLE